ncbi:hypothetical protein LMH87_012243 [Akanthomyces muscarius]|uniref:Uncharacterized protein n=1 Tax=Akanthomyces muscarius TaxID=2231603 RepID=A0A9W8ULU6_AKAMU|nr:hypothetical protein LMH87_012243 [Akanthomyces muscarius]KAJ4151551.1 hypothetical protein LMH87_012243 [Akanthomyces muscarius]
MMYSLITMSITLAAIAAQASASIYPVSIPQGFFPGANNGVIGSWYRASAGQDATNGQSWCGYTYKNSDPIFAVSLKAMGGATYNSNPDAWRAQSRKYCGLEAQVTDPSTGKTSLLYIGDAFDDAWIKRTGSIDIMIDAFSNLHGNPNGNKNTLAVERSLVVPGITDNLYDGESSIGKRRSGWRIL